ncbi:beta-galactosidase [bacterium]|nr:beta-galactosidase [bacterium]
MILPRWMSLALCALLLTAACVLADPPGLQVVPAADGSHVAVAARDGKPLYCAGPGLTAVSLPQTPTQEGTLSFCFTPDWSPGDCTTHWLLELKGQGLQIAFRKGYSAAISPDYCYLLTDPEGSIVGFHPENLFRARERHHYAIRWTTARQRIQFVVDGEAAGRAGKFKCDSPAQIPATLTLYGMAGGTFDDIHLYGKYLTVPEILLAAGLKEPARDLQSQPPPRGAGRSEGASGTPAPTREYVDPATGQLVGTLEDDQKALLPPYNPADYPDLPVTPHTKWARPLAGGKLRILLVATHGFYDEYSMIREAAELWQRLDCDILVTNQPDPRVMSRDFDVIAVSLQGFTNGRWAGWADLDVKLRAWILERVKSGKSGLVWAYPTQPDEQISALLAPQAELPAAELLRGFPAEALPQANAADGKGAFRWDKVYDLDDSYFLTRADAGRLVEVHGGVGGRSVVKLNYKNASWYPNMGLTADSALNAAATDVQYDEWMALAARAMLVAAGRATTTQIAKATPGPQGWRVELLTPLSDLSQFRLRARARDMWGRTSFEQSLVVRGPLINVPAPPLPPRTTLDLILRDAQGNAVDWFIATPPAPTDPHVTGIKLDRAYYQPGQAVQASLTVQAAHPEQCTLELFLTDHEGRRLRKSAPVRLATGSATCRVAIPASADSLLMRVEADLKLNGVIADTRSADVPVPQMTPRGFYPLLYGTPLNRFCVRARHRLFRDQFGVRGGFHQGPHSWANLAALNLTCIEYSGHLGYPQKQSDCEDFAENWEQNVTKWLMGPPDKMIPYRPLFYSLGEEHFVLLSACPTPTANAKFRAWLQGKYGTLDRLNTVWGSKVATWDDITMMTPEIVDMLKIQFDVVRFENRRFMEHLFADRHAFLADYLRKATAPGTDAPTQTGIHAGWDLWMGRGYDYWLLSRAMEDMMCYGGPHNHYARSFFERYYGSHYHYNIGSHGNVRWHPWYMLLSGAHGLSWYTDAPQIWGATTADLHLTSDWTAAQDEFRAVADAGELLTRMQYRDDQVAIHYSQDSFQAGVSDLTWMHQRFINLCFDTGTPFRFVSYAQIEQGDLLQRRPKLLILPHSVALSEAECQGIRDYVAAGGVVWADIIPGTYNNFGQKLEKSQLADLFAGLRPSKTHFGLDTLSGPAGNGLVILADIGNYSYDRNVGRYQPAADLYDRVAQLAQLDRPVQPLDAGSRGLANGIWAATWTNGTATHIAAAKDYQLADQTPAKVILKLSRSGHVYEMRSGKYLGHVDYDLPAMLVPTQGQVFTILPYRVQGLTLRPAAATRGQDLVLRAALQTEGAVGKGDLNVLQVRVTDPRGREVTALRRTVEMRGGRAEVRLPVAYGDGSGRWTVAVRDLATGTMARCAYVLGPAK